MTDLEILERTLEERNQDQQLLIQALQAMLDTALQTDDAAWAAGIERAGTDRPCDEAAHAIAYVVGAGMLDVASHSYLRAAGRKDQRRRTGASDECCTHEQTRLEVER